MSKRMWIINLLCVLSLVGLGWKLARGWRQHAAQNGPQALEMHPLSGVAVPPPLPAADYTAVARQNPFHADRNDVITEPAQAKTMGPPPLVYGSLILGNSRSALLGREQSPKAERVAEGATFDGYRVVRVLPESVVLESSAGQQEIMFYNAMERLRRQAARTSANAKPGSSAPAVAPGNGANTSSVAVTSVDTVGPATSQAGQAMTAPPVAAPAGREWVDTPFGRMLFDKKKP
jgi:hypothetical protein